MKNKFEYQDRNFNVSSPKFCYCLTVSLHAYMNSIKISIKYKFHVQNSVIQVYKKSKVKNIHPLYVNCLSTVHSVRSSRYPVTQSHWPVYRVLAHCYLKYDCQFQCTQKKKNI
jgi:hypothetical protein